GFPGKDFPGLRLAHPVHQDLLDDHVAAAHGHHDVAGLDVGGGEEPADGVGHQPGIHHFALDDGVIGHGRHGNLFQHRVSGAVVDHHGLDVPAADVETHRGACAGE